MLTDEFGFYVLVGFAAQMIDGALGMAYGVTASSLLLGLGLPPAVTSATVHAAECVTTGVSGVAHHAFGNVHRPLFRRLLVPGVAGAIVGAYLLSNLPGDAMRPYVAVYLMGMGVIIMFKAYHEFPSREVISHVAPLGFVGAFVDAIGGGGWGPIVASSLIARGNDVRTTIGSVNAVEFFVTFAASVTFLITLGISHWTVIAGLALGGLFAAPVGAWASRHLPIKPLMIAVGVLVVLLSLRTLLIFFGLL